MRDRSASRCVKASDVSFCNGVSATYTMRVLRPTQTKGHGGEAAATSADMAEAELSQLGFVAIRRTTSAHESWVVGQLRMTYHRHNTSPSCPRANNNAVTALMQCMAHHPEIIAKAQTTNPAPCYRCHTMAARRTYWAA